MLPIYRIFVPNFSTSKLFPCSVFLVFLPLRFLSRFSLSLFIVPCHSKTLMTQSKMSDFLSLVLIVHWHVLTIVIDGLIQIFLSAFHPKETLILSPLLRLPKGKSLITVSPYINESASLVRCRNEIFTQLCTTFHDIFSLIVVSDNKRFSILVRLVYANWSVSEMDICLLLFPWNVVVNDVFGRFLRLYFKWGFNKFWFLAIKFCSLATCSIYLLAFGSIFSLAFGSIFC